MEVQVLSSASLDEREAGSAVGKEPALTEGREDFVRVTVRVDPAQDARHVAVGVDHERRALVGVLPLLGDPVRLAQLVLGVGEQRERELVLGLEPLVRGLRVGADAEHRGARPLEFAVGVADSAGLPRAAGRVVLRIKIQYDRLTTKG